MSKKLPMSCTGGIKVKCGVDKIRDTIVFDLGGKCKFTRFHFVDAEHNHYLPPGFSNSNPPSGGGDEISYEYDGSGMAENGYDFEYGTDSPLHGNGSGTIKNR